MSEQFFTIQQNYKEKFFKLPQVFFTNEKYKPLSNDAKIAYAILENRLSISIKNNWVDENGTIYFIYTNEKLMSFLNCKKEKLSKLKKELENANLLIQKRQGLNKPNKLYLMKPIITKDDIYTIQAYENDETPTDTRKFENRTSRSSKIELQEVRKSNTNKTDINKTDINKTDNDLNDMNDREEESNKKDIQTNHASHSSHNSITDDEAIKDYYLNSEALELLPKIKSVLSSFNSTDIKIILNTLWKALASFEKDCEESNLDKGYFAVEDIEDEIEAVLRRFKGALHVKKENVQSMQKYLMTSLKRALEKQRDILKAEINYEVMNNWLETDKKEDNQQQFVKNEEQTFATDDKNLNDLIARFRNS
ncbi:replication initiator protein A [Phocicoccus pinnipedialis]|uniref:Replication initiator A N-terminal domain-containing protein n=1 Tax=Phocicoccus pinnipedialis TaxID=110845 RepID=A0A6V7RQ13_9BACL|nr:replication initiator protein A [Jeotgalicoccus pinnipedialis]MBP1940270.1 23S rRNA pseudoU1915 N3-methylase RlmH [Jeotgalicoccus pinnipedialis]CAD2079727.1 hypothetical protein JEOPIN946_01608 [Jeotgalicoccus pinnipedialis]